MAHDVSESVLAEKTRVIADAVRNVELSKMEAWNDLDVLSLNTHIEAIEVFEDEILRYPFRCDLEFFYVEFFRERIGASGTANKPSSVKQLISLIVKVAVCALDIAEKIFDLLTLCKVRVIGF